MKLFGVNMNAGLKEVVLLSTMTLSLSFFAAGNDVKDVFASAKSGDEYRALKIVIEDGEPCPRDLGFVYSFLCQENF